MDRNGNTEGTEISIAIPMSISALYIFDSFGRPLIWRHYRGVPRPDFIDKFLSCLIQKEEDTPVMQIDDVTMGYVRYKNLFVAALTSGNANMALVFVFLYRLVEMLNEYFDELEEESVRDNFVVIYELLDEILDFGYPQITETKILMEYITQETKRLDSKRTLPPAITNAVSWRSEGIKYKKNEVYLEITEYVDLTANGNGSVVRNDISGSVKLKTYLSGMPELRLGLNDRLFCEKNDMDLNKSVELEVLRFHQCVRLAKFENDRSICFIPPDGDFELMSYRLINFFKPPILVECVRRYFPNKRVEYSVKTMACFKKRFVATDVEILIPVPSDADSPVFKATVGSVSYIPEKNVCEWFIKYFQGAKELQMTAVFRLPSVSKDEHTEITPPVEVKFEITFFTISGIKVQFLTVFEKSKYQTVKGVRYVTQNGAYQIRPRMITILPRQNT